MKWRAAFDVTGRLNATVFLVWGLSFPMWSWAQTDVRRAAMFSTDRRFMVSGMNSAENMVLAGELANFAADVERKIGMPLPFSRDQVLTVMVAQPGDAEVRVTKFQGWDGDRFYQRLLLPERTRLDQEDLVEGFCWLLLNRYASSYTPRERRVGMGASMPDWIAVGFGQNLLPILKTRNRDWLVQEIADGKVMPLQDVVKLEFLPTGRWREKMYAATAVDLLWPEGNTSAWVTLFGAVAGQKSIDAVWLRTHVPALRQNTEHPEKLWNDWLRQYAQTQSATSWGDFSMRQEEKLLQLLTFAPRELVQGSVPFDVPEFLHAKDLIEYRNASWVRAAAGVLALRIQGLGVGTMPDFRSILSAYAVYFEQLTTLQSEMPERRWWQRKSKPPASFNDTSWEIALRQLWARAERMHHEFLLAQQIRRTYVDKFDLIDIHVISADVPIDTPLPRTRIQEAVDAFDSYSGTSF